MVLHESDNLRLIDGNRIIRGHKTEYTLAGYVVDELQSIRDTLISLALTEEAIDTLFDCVVTEFPDLECECEEFIDFVERIKCILKSYTDKILQTTPIPNEKKAPVVQCDFLEYENVPF